MSTVVLSCTDSWAETAPPYPPPAAGSEGEPSLRVLRPTERQVLALLGTHEVLTYPRTRKRRRKTLGDLAGANAPPHSQAHPVTATA
ncbi:MAG: hypothetical protein ACYCVN_07650 [Acidimicrobiales bacterium]